MSLEVIVFLVALALAFDFMNGFHDAANSIATIVSTRVLRPQWAVVWAAFFNFAALAVFGVAVAATVGKGIIDAAAVDHYVVFGALVGAIAWNVITWYYGIPSSSSHALIGGLAGWQVRRRDVALWKRVRPAVLSAGLLGCLLAGLGLTGLFVRLTQGPVALASPRMAAHLAGYALIGAVVVFFAGLALTARRHMTRRNRRSGDVIDAHKVGDAWVTYGWEKTGPKN